MTYPVEGMIYLPVFYCILVFGKVESVVVVFECVDHEEYLAGMMSVETQLPPDADDQCTYAQPHPEKVSIHSE